MKKVCFITTVPITLKAFILEFVKYMHSMTDYDITFICDYDEEFEKILPEYIHYVPIEMKRGISFGGIVACLKMIKVFKKYKFDMVQYSTPNASLYASIAAKIAGIKIRNYHIMGFRYLGQSGITRCIFKALDKLTCKNSTHIECVSKSNMALGVNEKLFPKVKATVVWNGSTGGVNLKRFDFDKRNEWRSEIRNKLGYKENDFIFGFVGRITKDKGINELLTAYFNMNTDSKLLIIGMFEGVETLDIKLYEWAKCNTNIKFLGTVYNIEEYYAAIDVLVLPTYREGFGNVIIEAGAVGTPAIITDIPGPIDAVVRDKTAKIVGVKNADQLQKAMEEVESDRELLKRMSLAAYEFVSKSFDDKILNEKILKRKQELLRS